MEDIPALESEFLARAREIGGDGRLTALLDAVPVTARAWPICLRQVAVEHVRVLVRSLRLLPRSPQVAESALQRGSVLDVAEVGDWLWAVHQSQVVTSGEDDPRLPAWATSAARPRQAARPDRRGLPRPQLRHRLSQCLTAPTTLPAFLAAACEEIDEASVRRAVENRYGAVTDEHRQQMQRHLANLDALVRAAAQHGPDTWTTQERRVHAYNPTDALAAMKEAAWMSPQDYMEAVKEQLHGIVGEDPDSVSSGITGDSQLRPRAVYPTA